MKPNTVRRSGRKGLCITPAGGQVGRLESDCDSMGDRRHSEETRKAYVETDTLLLIVAVLDDVECCKRVICVVAVD